MKKVAGLLCIGSFLILLLQGLRNRRVPRWLTVVGLVSQVAITWYNRWEIENCWTPSSFVSLGAIVLMYVHQLLPRRDMMSN